MTFLECWDQTRKDRRNYNEWMKLLMTFWVWKFDLFWPDLELSLTLSLVNCKYECHNGILPLKWLRKHASHGIHTYNIFTYWSYATWAWPWPALSTRPLVIRYLLHLLRNILAGFGLAAVVSPSSVAGMQKKTVILTFDLTLTWIVTSKDFLWSFLKKYSMRTFYRHLARLATAFS